MSNPIEQGHDIHKALCQKDSTYTKKTKQTDELSIGKTIP